MRQAELRRRSNRRSSPRSRQGGFSLVEIVIAILLVAVMMASVMSAALSAKSSGGRSERKVIAGMATSQLSSQLSDFVTSYWCYAAVPGSPTCPAIGWAATGVTDIDGPMVTSACASGSGACTWSWGNYPSGCGGGGLPCITDSAGGYALKAGVHTLTNFLPAWFEAAPYNARISYTVNVAASVSGGTSPTVSIAVNWTEP